LWSTFAVAILYAEHVQSRGLRLFHQEPSGDSDQSLDIVDSENQGLLPEGLISVLIGSKADEWTKEGQKVLKGELEDTIASADVKGSCQNATSTVIKSFRGFKAHIISQLRKICRSNQMNTPSRSAVCEQYTSGMATYLTGNQKKNLQIDLGDFCGDIYDKGVLQAAEDQQAADDEVKAKAKKETARQLRLKKQRQEDDALAVLSDADEGLKEAELKHKRPRQQTATNNEQEEDDDISSTDEEFSGRLEDHASDSDDSALLRKEIVKQAETGAQSLDARLMRQERIESRQHQDDNEGAMEEAGAEETRADDEAATSEADPQATQTPESKATTGTSDVASDAPDMPADEVAMDAANAALSVSTDDSDTDMAPPSVASAAIAAAEARRNAEASQTNDVALATDVPSFATDSGYTDDASDSQQSNV